MDVRLLPDATALARAAAADAADALVAAIAERGTARAMFASGRSQLAVLDELAAHPEVDWSRVVGFHMDEYVGLHGDHLGSLARFMRERVVAVLRPGIFHLLDGAAVDPAAEAVRYGALVAEARLDLCLLGLGENGHLAFNDPTVARIDDPLAAKVVQLERASREQQVGEGLFPTLDAVPAQAITVTLPALLGARRVLALAPEARKAAIVARALEGPIDAACPASYLRTVEAATLYLEPASAAALRGPR